MADSHKRHRRAVAVTAAEIQRDLDRGLTWAECAKLRGVSIATLARRLKHGDPEQLRPARPAAAVPPSQHQPEAPADADLDDLDARKRRALRAIRAAYAEGGAQAMRAAGLDMADVQRAQAEGQHRDAMADLEHVGAAAVGLVLGAILRARIDAGDDALGELYRASASASASDEDREALAAWLDTHPEVAAEVAIALARAAA